VMGYGLGGWGSNPDKGKIFLFSTTFGPDLRSTQPPIQWAPGEGGGGIFPGGKAAGAQS
jgi:hypothetical protein